MKPRFSIIHGSAAAAAALLLFSLSFSATGKTIDRDRQGIPGVKVGNAVLTGTISDENAALSLEFDVDAERKGLLPVISGNVCETDSEIKTEGGFLFFGGGDFKLEYSNRTYYLRVIEPGKCSVRLDFSAKVEEKGKWKECAFSMLPAIQRRIGIKSERRDMELKISDALKLKKSDEAGGAVFSAILPPEGPLQIQWRGSVEEIDAELVCSAKANIVAELAPGSIRMNNFYMYSVIQGKLSKLRLKVSPGLNILNVQGENIQQWHVDDPEKNPVLVVSLSKEYEDIYSLKVEAEKVLPEFPCNFRLPSIIPGGVLSLDGDLAFGTSRAIKIVVESVSGLNQVDNDVFPLLRSGSRIINPVPRRSLFTYQFSGEEYGLKAGAENIMPSYTAQLAHVVTFKDRDMLVKATLALDIKDAPLRELVLKHDSKLTVNRVEGQAVIPDDYEVSRKDGTATLKIPFKPETIGKTILFIHLEKRIENEAIKITPLVIEDLKSVRGDLALAAARGLTIEPVELEALKKVHTSSAPVREAGLQHAYKFKNQEWAAEIVLKKDRSSLVSEVLHLSSLGEGAAYGSSVFTYHISGAPLDNVRISLAREKKNIEFTGRDIVDWKNVAKDDQSQTWQINFREKVFGDYNFLATYESPLPDKGSIMRFGKVSTAGADAESGYIVVTSVRNLSVKPIAAAESVIEIEKAEIPRVFRKLLHNPVLKAWSFISSPSWAEARIESYPPEDFVGMAVDYASLSSQIDVNGEIVTTARYRVKNNSGRNMAIKLPEDADPWSMEVDGLKPRVSISGDRYLIPLPRHHDTSRPISVAVTYAEKQDELGAESRLTLTAPDLDVETLYSSWQVDIPREYSFTSFAGGNMRPEKVPQLIGLSGFVARSIAGINYLIGKWMFPLWIALAALGAMIAWNSGRKKYVVSTAIICGLALSAVLFAWGASFIVINDGPMELKLKAVNTCVFSKLFCLPGDSLKLNMGISNMSAVSFSKILYSLLFAFLTVAFFKISRKTQGLRKNVAAACALTMLAGIGSQWLLVNALAALAASLCVTFGIPLALWVILFRRGRAAVAVQAALALAIFFLLPAAHRASAGTGAPPAKILIRDAQYEVRASEDAVAATAKYDILAEDPGRIVIIPAPAVLEGEFPENSHLELVREGDSYVLVVKSSGEYNLKLNFLVPMQADGNGNNFFAIKLPVCRRNRTVVNVDIPSMDVKAENAIFFKKKKDAGKTLAEAVFTPGDMAVFRLSPEVREVKKEKSKFFAKIDALANFAPGFVEIKNHFSFQIAQGVVSKFLIEVPGNMRVTGVDVADLGAWRFDPAARMLEIFLSEPHSGRLSMHVVTQIANCTLPYGAAIEPLRVEGASRQHGTVGIVSESNVQVNVEKSEGYNRMNTSDFKLRADKGQIVKKAFLYHKPPALLELKSTPVKPELRVREQTELSFEEEQTRMICNLELEVAKAGIFSIAINIPKGFEIDKVNGNDIQHWDEITGEDGNRLVVHFEKRALGKRPLRIELLSMETVKQGEMAIPKISVEKVEKHKGELTINVERGTRMEVIERVGLEEKTIGFKKHGAETRNFFSIVRRDWSLKVSFDIIEPWIQVEHLQIGRVTPKVVNFRTYFNYSIENAGVKYLRIRLPDTAETPEFIQARKQIVGTRLVQDNLWEIELNRKVMRKFSIEARYRQPYDGKSLSVEPAVAEGAELQKGYLVMVSEDALQIKSVKTTGEITDFDPRKIPVGFRSENLANAVACYRTVGGEYIAEFDVVRHDAASLLKAQINSVSLMSVASREGRTITTALIDLDNANQTYLRVRLPEGSTTWSAFIEIQDVGEEEPVEVGREGDDILIPLKQATISGSVNQKIRLVYSIETDEGWNPGKQVYRGPKINLPLRNISWKFYLPPDFEYDGFGGTLEYQEKDIFGQIKYSKTLSSYDHESVERQARRKMNVQTLYRRANKLKKEGRQEDYTNYMQSALNLSNDAPTTKADIQNEWMDMQREQTISALANRRQIVHKSSRIGAEQQLPEENLQQIKQELGGAEIKNLEDISDKIFMQQQAAKSVPHPLGLSVPEEGKVVEFKRALQIDENSDMQVHFNADEKIPIQRRSQAWALIVSLAASFLLIQLGRATLKKYSLETGGETV